MNASPNIHWTEDSQLLEEFVLHRVEATRRKELEAHLLECEKCQQAVNEEQKMVLGIKRVGRDEMRSRLKERLVESQRRPEAARVSWTWVYSAAAALVILVGLGLYNRWLPLEKSHPTEERPNAQQNQSAPAEKGEVRQESAAQPKSEDKKKESADLTRDEKDKSQKLELRDDRRTGQPNASDVAAYSRVPSNLPPSSQGAGIIRRDIANTADQLSKNAVEEYRPVEGLWVDGILLTGETSERSKKTLKMDEGARPAQQGAATKASVSQKTFNATVSEFSISDLPASQQMRKQRLQSNTVQTQFAAHGNELHLQLYRQQQKEQRNSTHRATIQQIGRDSIIVNVGNEQIGYKIQGGVDALMNTKKK
jgi:hypothetical protein